MNPMNQTMKGTNINMNLYLVVISWGYFDETQEAEWFHFVADQYDYAEVEKQAVLILLVDAISLTLLVANDVAHASKQSGYDKLNHCCASDPLHSTY